MIPPVWCAVFYALLTCSSADELLACDELAAIAELYTRLRGLRFVAPEES